VKTAISSKSLLSFFSVERIFRLTMRKVFRARAQFEYFSARHFSAEVTLASRKMAGRKILARLRLKTQVMPAHGIAIRGGMSQEIAPRLRRGRVSQDLIDRCGTEK
jgi:hypothetical protein